MTTATTTPTALMTTEEAREVLGRNYLYDDWEMHGAKPSEFFKILKCLDAVTEHKVVFLRDLVLLSPAGKDEESVQFRVMSGSKTEGHKVSRSACEAAGVDIAYDETVSGNRCLLRIGRERPMFTRPKSLRELMGNLGLAGSAIETQTLYRDFYVADLLEKTPAKRKSTIITRSDGNDIGGFYEKVFSVRTGKYTPISLSELEDVFNAISEQDMGVIECAGWSIDHDYASIDLMFPEATAEFKELCGLRDDIQAGVRLTTSGTGYACFTAKEIWQVSGTVSEHACVKNKHIGDWNPEEFVEKVKETIFDEYCKLPERLCELFDCVLVSGDMNAVKAEAVLRKCLKALFRHIRLAEAFKSKEDAEGKKSYVNELTDKLVDKFKIEIEKAGKNAEITAYDVAVSVMELPGKVTGIPKSYMVNFSNACGQAAYFPFKIGEEYLKSKKPEIEIGA